MQNGPGPFNGFVPTLKDAKAAFSAAWCSWLEAAGLVTVEVVLPDSDSGLA